MYVRKKKNKSGIISVQVIDKSSGHYKVLRTMGSSADPDAIENLYKQGKEFIQTYQGQQILTFPEQDFKEAVKRSIKGIDIEGVNLLLGKVYSAVGFDKIESELFRQLVIIRLTHPASKLKPLNILNVIFQ